MNTTLPHRVGAPQAGVIARERCQVQYNSVKTAGSGVRLRILNTTKDRTGYVVKLDSAK